MKTFEISQATFDDIQNRFAYHKPDEDRVERHGAVRNSLQSVALKILSLTPPGREQALALTKLEEAMVWANAAIARSPRDNPGN